MATEILHSDRNKTPEQKAINSIRTLAMDAVQKANSGHPGTPISLAPLTYTLWQKFLNFDPANPIWPNRDRFVLSAGHASMLIYSMIHLAGVKTVGENYSIINEPAVSLDAIKNFRQLDSKTPAIQNIIGLVALKLPPDLLAKALQPRLVWQWLSDGLPLITIDQDSNFSNTMYIPFAAMVA